MPSFEIEIARNGTSEFVAQALPDGSVALFEVATRNVYSLNASAAAAWEACGTATTLSRVAAAMSQRLNTPVTDDLAHHAVSELAAVGLVRITAPEEIATSRRTLLKQVAGVALPAVLVLTGAEQRAYAQGSNSGPIIVTTRPGTTAPGTTAPGTTSPAPSGPPASFSFVKRIVPSEEHQPAVGFEFDLLNSSLAVVAHLVTDSEGRAGATDLPPGQYTLVETLAPGGPFVPFEPRVFTLTQGLDLGFDITNQLLQT